MDIVQQTAPVENLIYFPVFTILKTEMATTLKLPAVVRYFQFIICI